MKKPEKGSLRLDLGHAWDMGFEIVKDILSLFFLELNLAKQNIIVLISLAALLVLFIITIWFCAMWLFVLWLLSFNLSLATALFISLLVNLLLSIVILIVINKSRKNISFDATREELKNLMEADHE